MPTTVAEFNAHTEGVEVAKRFADGIRGKTVLITGVNRAGIGFSTAQAFASQSPKTLIIAGRTPSKVQECIDLLRAEYPSVGDYRALHVDLSSQASVRAAAAELLAWADVGQVDLVINSAGVMGIAERTLSPEGIEMHLATNHIGHFLLTCLIIPKLLRAAAASPRKGAVRVVNVTSASPQLSKMRWSDVNFETVNRQLPAAEQPDYTSAAVFGYSDPEDKAYYGLEAYNQSKVANVLFSVALTRRLYDAHGILSLAAHPGVIPTELVRYFPAENRAAIDRFVESSSSSGLFEYKSLAAGASTSLVAALDPALGPPPGESESESETRTTTGENENGKEDGAKKEKKENVGFYLVDCQISDQAHPLAISSAEAERLWKLSEELVGEKFAW
ncbi:hypothetical protein F4778DRAFT_800316 [Xylariomycetidae sp. FL2044]|nr:hypothetical protein F4778DRAFT_800316 [Xylariomycetidae sp. FL2044]